MVNNKGEVFTLVDNLQLGDLLIYSGEGSNSSKNLYVLEHIHPHAISTIQPTKRNNKWNINIRKNGTVPFMKIEDLEDIQGTLNQDAFQEYLKITLPKSNNYREFYSGEYPSIWDKELTITKERTKMQNLKDSVTQANSNAAKAAATVTAGAILNKTLIAKVKPQLPMLLRGYADHALADVVLANIVNFAVLNFVPENDKALKASEAMMVAAMATLMQSFNIEDLVEELLKDVNLPN